VAWRERRNHDIDKPIFTVLLLESFQQQLDVKGLEILVETLRGAC